MKFFTQKLLFLFLGILFAISSSAQLNIESIATDPAYPTMDAPITIYINVNHWGELNASNFTAYTGLVTSESDNSHGWTYLKNSDWNDFSLELDQVQDSIYALVIDDPKAFYGIPDGVATYRITFIVRGLVDGANAGQTEDLFLEVYGSEPTSLFSFLPETPTDKDLICTTWNINVENDENSLTGNTDSIWVHTWLNNVSGPATGSGAWPDNSEKYLCERVNDSLLRWFIAPNVREFYEFEPWTYSESIGVLIRNKEGNAQTNDFQIPLISERELDFSLVNPVLIYPVYPTVEDEIVIYINTNHWNFDTENGFISAYTGLITGESTDIDDSWQHLVNSDWNDVSLKLEQINDSISAFMINNIEELYEVDNKTEPVFRITFIAREVSNTDSSVVNQTENLYFEIYNSTPSQLVQLQPVSPSEDDAIAFTFNISSQVELTDFVAENGKDSIFIYTWLNTDDGEGNEISAWGDVSSNKTLKTIAVNDSVYRFYVPKSVRSFYGIDDSCLHVLSTNLILRNVAGDIQSENIIVEVTQNDVDCTGVGVDDLQSLFPIKVFPNPVSDFLTISCTSDNMQNTQIELYSITGVKVYSSISDLSNNSCIDVSRFDKGIYLLKIQSNLGRVNSTIIIQ
jgi:hypothetical protein